VHRLVPLGHSRGERVDGLPVADVAGFRLGAQLPGECVEPLAATRDEDEPPAVPRKTPREGLADPARPSRYDRDANVRRVLRLISTVSSIGSA